MAWFAGIWVGAEVAIRVPYFKGMALGWKLLSVFGVGYLAKTVFTAYNS
jgi:hypothetical protein